MSPRRIYIATTPEDGMALICVPPEAARTLKEENGWSLLEIGTADRKTMPGQLASISRLTPKFEQNTEMLAV